MKTVCDVNSCVGCKLCLEVCSQSAIHLFETMESINAVIDVNKCINCGACKRVCQNINPPKLTYPLTWYQGWNNDTESRAKSSSGGFAYCLMQQFIAEGGCVCACTFSEGKILYKFAEEESQLEMFRGSKYVKSDPEGVYSKIKKILEDKKVLFIGLPCHVGALKKYVGDHKDLVTVDLVCHGTPSFLLVEKYFRENGICINNLKNVWFREKNKFRIRVEYKAELAAKKDSLTPQNVRDRYTIGFLNGLFYTENCYHCQYAGLERVSDITIGDSWGSDLEGTGEEAKGISLALCQTEKGEDLIRRCNLHLLPVDLERAANANHQLREPSLKPLQRATFLSNIKKGKSIKYSVKRCYPKICYRQDMKAVLIKSHLL